MVFQRNDLWRWITNRSNPVQQSTWHKGWRVVHRFDNGYGVSMVCHHEPYGPCNYQLTGVWFNGDKWHECYNVNKIEGYLTESEVDTFLQKVKALPQTKGANHGS